MRLHILVSSLLTIALLGCEVDQPPAMLANGVDIYLPDGASLALDGAAQPDPATVPTAAEIRATSPSPVTNMPPVMRYQGGGEQAAVRPMDQPRRFHLAWLRVSIPQPDGSSIVTQSHRATDGTGYWAEPSIRRVAPGDAVPVP